MDPPDVRKRGRHVDLPQGERHQGMSARLVDKGQKSVQRAVEDRGIQCPALLFGRASGGTSPPGESLVRRAPQLLEASERGAVFEPAQLVVALGAWHGPPYTTTDGFDVHWLLIGGHLRWHARGARMDALIGRELDGHRVVS